MRLKRYLLILTALFPAGLLMAGNGGSGYSRYGIGDLSSYASDRSIGMGGASIGRFSGADIDRLNPAAWSQITRARFSIGALYEGFATADDRKSTYLAGTRFDGFMFALPVWQSYGFVVAGGMTSYSRVNYRVIVPVTQIGSDATVDYDGEGGVSAGQLGASALPFKDLSLGLKLQYYFGTMRHGITQTFTGGSFTNSGIVRSSRVGGLGATFGLVYSGLKHIAALPEGQSLTVGFVVSNASDITATDERYYSYTAGSTSLDTLIGPDGTLRIPVSAGGGIAYSSGQYLVAADLYYQNWNAALFNGVKDPNLRDSYRFGIGGEISPKRTTGVPFFQRLAYRGGLFYNQTYYQVKGQAIDEIGITGGVGVPIFTDTRFNLAVSYSVRGTTEQQLQKDRILRISFTFNVGELWFVRPQEE